MLNQLKTILLLGALSCLIIWLGRLVGGTDGMYIAFIAALIINGISYFFSDTLVLRLYKAQPLDTHIYARVYTMVQELAHRMQIPMPRLWLIDTPMANAFATGRNPQHGSIALTRGIIDLLSADELRGVIAHELAHIRNRDILISTIAAVLASTISHLADLLRWKQDHKRNRFVDFVVFGIVLPLAALLIQLAISRSREYLADSTGAYYAQDPLALAHALSKLGHHVSSAHFKPESAAYASTASLFIVHPFVSDYIQSLFSTHPPLNQRIALLKQMHEKKFTNIS